MSKVLQFQVKNKSVGSMEIKNQTPKAADLYFYGDIVSDDWGKWCDDDKCPTDVAKFLKDLEEVENINIHMNSGGGSVFGGIAIYNQLKRYNATVTTYIDGLAASIASVIAMAGDKIIMPKNATLMIHKPMSSLWGGNADDFRKTADILDTCQKTILNTYMTRAKEGVTEDQINQMINEETWLTGDEAEKYFNIEVEESIQVVACTSDYFDKYEKIPENLKENLEEKSSTCDSEKLKEVTDKVNKTLDALERLGIYIVNGNKAESEKEKLKNQLLEDLDYL